MHHCLSVPGLVDEITSHCNQASLANLARTARLFDCALDRLWAGVSLNRLIQCLSSEVVKRSPRASGPFLTLVNHPEPRHWDQFHLYGKRVKKIWLNMNHVDDTFIDVLCLHAPEGGLLPCLQAWSLEFSHPSQLRLLRPFTSPILKDVSFCVEGDESLQDSVSTFLSSLPNLCPKLTELKLWLPSGDYLPDLPAPLQSLQHLQELNIEIEDKVDVAYFPVIASLPHLTSLTLVCLDHGATLPQPTITDTCRSLEYLDVTSTTNSIRTLFRCISKCPVKTLFLEIEDDVCIGLDEIFLAIRDACERNTLSTLEIDIDISSEDPLVMNCDSLSPFFDFPNITQFHCPLGMVPVDDRHFSMLSRSWPRLTILDVSYYEPPRPGGMLLPIECLESLVRHFPLLRRLKISLDATNVDFDADRIPADGACCRFVTTLGVTYSPICRAPSVAGYLSSLFPNLQNIYGKSNPGGMSLWWDVEEIIRIITTSIRHQELLRKETRVRV